VNILAKVVGVQRGADALVYGAIIFLLYFVLLLLRKADTTNQDITFLVREIALDRVYTSPTTPVHTGDILFLVRSYNESTRIVQTLQSIYDSGYGDILVVDDGSTDGTYDILARDFLGAYTYIRHAKNCGAGAALETGLEYVRRNISTKNWKYVCTFDADGQHDIADIPTFLAAFECDKKLDIVLGSRFIVPTQSNVPYIRRCILWGGKIFTSMISGVHLTDAHNGYRMMKVHTTRDIHISMDGMEYASEYIDQIRGMHIAEVPVNIHYDDYTMAK
jgi:glycosyltransferase involved in cell wall biosynthesis